MQRAAGSSKGSPLGGTLSLLFLFSVVPGSSVYPTFAIRLLFFPPTRLCFYRIGRESFSTTRCEVARSLLLSNPQLCQR